MTIDIDKLRAAHAATKERRTPDFRELRDDDLRDVELPFTAYDVELHYNTESECFYKASIHKIKLTWFGIKPGCTGNSVDFMRDGKRCTGATDLFYPTREDAEAYADMCIEEARRAAADKDFQALAHNEWPALLDEIERLRNENFAAAALLREFQRTISNSLEGDHPDADEVDQWLERNSK